MDLKEEDGLKLDSGSLGSRRDEIHLLRWIKYLQQVHAFRKQIWKSNHVYVFELFV